MPSTKKVVRIAVEQVAGRLPVLAGVLEPSTARTVARMRRIERLGPSAVVVVAPYYLRATNDAQLLRHFEVIRDHTALEIAVYNLPGCVGAEIPIPVLCELAKRGWVGACKDSSGDDAYFAELCRRGAEHGLRVYQSLRPDFARLAELGAAGCVPVPANLRPELFAEAWGKRGDPVARTRLQASCNTLWLEHS
jgi:4-hydroxy-tetrahydrodipicolinate synthase